MASTYVHHRISAAPRCWRQVASALIARQTELSATGGALYGLWRSQIGRPRDEITAITVWPDAQQAAQAESALIGPTTDVLAIQSAPMQPTLRPATPDAPIRQGNYAFRWFATPERNSQEFLALCAEAWPGFESAYDSQVIGMWRCLDAPSIVIPDAPATAFGADDIVSLLLTRRPNLAMWERSKLPQGADEARVRDILSRRYDLCSWTVVHTTTLLTATDSEDNARWA